MGARFINITDDATMRTHLLDLKKVVSVSEPTLSILDGEQCPAYQVHVEGGMTISVNVIYTEGQKRLPNDKRLTHTKFVKRWREAV